MNFYPWIFNIDKHWSPENTREYNTHFVHSVNIKHLIKILNDLNISEIQFTVEPAKPGFGDVSSNISFLLAKKRDYRPGQGDIGKM